jgi:hypothetical protein
MIHFEKLDPHPEAEAFPRGDDDQSSMNESVSELGIVTPLHVIQNAKNPGRWFVIDGITRLKGAEENLETELPCITCECDNVTEFILAANCERRKVSTGTRIMAYMLRHKDSILAADDYYGDGRFSDESISKSKRVSAEQIEEFGRWTCLAIAQRLSVSDKDVRAAVELLRCHERRHIPEITMKGVTYKEREADFKDETDKSQFETVKSCMRGVLGGNTPIRRWRAGFSGRATTEHGKDEVDYASLGFRSMTSLVTVFNAWVRINPSVRGDLLRKFESVQKAHREKVLAEC